MDVDEIRRLLADPETQNFGPQVVRDLLDELDRQAVALTTVDGAKQIKDYTASGDSTYALVVQVQGGGPYRLMAAWPALLEKFGYMPRSEAEESIAWLVERLKPEAAKEISAALRFADRFPKLVPGSR